MKTQKRNAMMYRAIKAEFNVNFNKSFYELSYAELDCIADFADLFRIRPRYGTSPARTLFYRMTEYEKRRG